MNRARRAPATKPFVSGGVFMPNSAQNTPTRPVQQNVEQASPVVQQQRTPQKPQPTPQKPQQQQEPPKQLVQQQQKKDMEYDGGSAMDDDAVVDETGKPQFKKIFLTRKKSSVRAKEKKIRQNRQLRKAILPKNALMALNEVKGINVSDFIINSNVGGGFTAIVTVNENQYEGKGNSKMAAKNSACEKALRDFVIAKMRQKPRLPKHHSNSTEAMETSDNNDNVSDAGDSQKGDDDADDVPMVNLASFALYKLFSEWENDGYVIPEMHPSAGNVTPENGNGAAPQKEPKKPPIRTELPPNWEAMHPATLLCLMRPGLNYNDIGTIGEKPNVVQRIGVTVDGNDFIADGRSKKLARRNVAVAVCNSLFHTNFVKDEPIDLAA